MHKKTYIFQGLPRPLLSPRLDFQGAISKPRFLKPLSDLSLKARFRSDLRITLGPSSMTSRASPRYFAWYNMTHREGSWHLSKSNGCYIEGLLDSKSSRVVFYDEWKTGLHMPGSARQYGLSSLIKSMDLRVHPWGSRSSIAAIVKRVRARALFPL